ncbi:MAG: hypothetical protein ACRDZX_17260 [Acidimicrobiales bacterium]
MTAPGAMNGSNSHLGLALAGKCSHVLRLGEYPVAEAASAPGYGALFNPGLVHHGGTYHLFARAVRAGYRPNPGSGDRFLDYLSDVVVLTSADGRDYRFAYVLAPAGTAGAACFEDPRVQRVGTGGSEDLVMTYTWLSPPGDGVRWRIGAHRLGWDGRRFNLRAGTGRLLGPDGIANKDAVIFSLSDGRVAMVHRIHPDMQLAVFEDLDHLWDPGEEYWDDYLADFDAHTLLAPSRGALGVGAGAPPVRTDKGLLFFFHERRGDGAYTMNLALLDPANGQVLSRLPEAVLEPELEWERSGDVDNVIFVQGAHRDGDKLYITYGAADRCIGAATASVSHLLAALASVA